MLMSEDGFELLARSPEFLWLSGAVDVTCHAPICAACAGKREALTGPQLDQKPPQAEPPGKE